MKKMRRRVLGLIICVSPRLFGWQACVCALGFWDSVYSIHPYTTFKYISRFSTLVSVSIVFPFTPFRLIMASAPYFLSLLGPTELYILSSTIHTTLLPFLFFSLCHSFLSLLTSSFPPHFWLAACSVSITPHPGC